MADEQAFADFVRHRAAALYRYGYLLAGNHHDADDLVQEALIKLRTHWSRVRRRDDPTGYARTTMTRLHVSAWRRRRREWLTSDVPESAVADPGLDRVDLTGDVIRVRTALATLPPRQRAVLVLRYYEHLTDPEIAAALGVSRGTVRSQAARGLDKLRASGIAEELEVTRS
jgi:RNA polymerase sigma-70 factor (sigma-E family)